MRRGSLLRERDRDPGVQYVYPCLPCGEFSGVRRGDHANEWLRHVCRDRDGAELRRLLMRERFLR